MSGPNQKLPPGGPGEGQTPGNRPVVRQGTGGLSDEKLAETMDVSPGAAVPTQSEPSLSRRHDARLGQMFGKYRVESVLGKGGMGLVYEGEDTVLSRRVAIKFLPESLTASPKAVERFITEAQVAGRLNHPNIIALYDIWQEDEHYYIVMERLNPS